MGPALLNIFDQVQPVHGARHIDVREENLHLIGAGFQDSHRDISIGRLQDMEAGLLKVVSRCHPYKRFILDEQHAGGMGL